MIITYQGNGNFRLQSGELVLSVDPQNNRGKNDITLRTRMPAATAVFLPEEIAFPGEYEIKEVEIQGFQSPDSTDKEVSTIYLVRWEGMRLVFLGGLSQAPDAETLKEIEEPDILFLPTGSADVMEPAAAVKLARQLQPSIIIPGYMKSAADFLKAIGEKVEPIEKFVFKPKELVEKQGKVVLLASGT